MYPRKIVHTLIDRIEVIEDRVLNYANQTTRTTKALRGLSTCKAYLRENNPDIDVISTMVDYYTKVINEELNKLSYEIL